VSSTNWIARGGIRWAGHLHEPIYFYRKEGRLVACVDGAAPWLERWYDHVRSPEMMRELADLGINTIYLNFFKGYGRRFEAQQMARTGEVLREAKTFGLRSILYIQPTNFFDEFVEEVPQAADWIARDAQSREILYGGRQHRPIACLSAPGWIDYVAEMAAEAARAGADAILLDNINHNQCCCPRCQRAFCEQTGKSGSMIHQAPLEAEVIEWRCSHTEDVIRRIAQRAREVNPQIALCANPAFPRNQNVCQHGVDPHRLAAILDVFLLENRVFPRLAGDRPVHSSYAYHLMQAAGTLAAPSVWLPPLELPESPRQVAAQTVEPIVFGGHAVCCPWPLRPVGDAKAHDALPPWDAYFHWDDLRDAWADALQFSRASAEMLRAAEPWARVAVLHRPDWFAREFPAALRRLLTIDAALHAAWLPYRFVFEDEAPDAERVDVLLLPFGEQDESCECVKRFVAAGGRVMSWEGGGGELFGDPSVRLTAAALEAARRIAASHPAAAPFQPVDPAPLGVLHFVTGGPNGVTLWLLNLSETPSTFTLRVRNSLGSKLSHVTGCSNPPKCEVHTQADDDSTTLTVTGLDTAACLQFGPS